MFSNIGKPKKQTIDENAKAKARADFWNKPKTTESYVKKLLDSDIYWREIFPPKSDSILGEISVFSTEIIKAGFRKPRILAPQRKKDQNHRSLTTTNKSRTKGSKPFSASYGFDEDGNVLYIDSLRPIEGSVNQKFRAPSFRDEKPWDYRLGYREIIESDNEEDFKIGHMIDTKIGQVGLAIKKYLENAEEVFKAQKQRLEELQQFRQTGYTMFGDDFAFWSSLPTYHLVVYSPNIDDDTWDILDQRFDSSYTFKEAAPGILENGKKYQVFHRFGERYQSAEYQYSFVDRESEALKAFDVSWESFVRDQLTIQMIADSKDPFKLFGMVIGAIKFEGAPATIKGDNESTRTIPPFWIQFAKSDGAVFEQGANRKYSEIVLKLGTKKIKSKSGNAWEEVPNNIVLPYEIVDGEKLRIM